MKTDKILIASILLLIVLVLHFIRTITTKVMSKEYVPVVYEDTRPRDIVVVGGPGFPTKPWSNHPVPHPPHSRQAAFVSTHPRCPARARARSRTAAAARGPCPRTPDRRTAGSWSSPAYRRSTSKARAAPTHPRERGRDEFRPAKQRWNLPTQGDAACVENMVEEPDARVCSESARLYYGVLVTRKSNITFIPHSPRPNS